MRQKQNYQNLESEFEALQERVAALEILPQTGQDDGKTNLATQPANANTRLINFDFDKLKLELKESNQQWLWDWTSFLGVMFAVFGLALWFVVKSLIADRVEKDLKGFQESVEQAKKQQERIRIIEREYAALMLAEPEEITQDDEYIYSDTVMSLSKQTIIDVINHKTYSIYVRIRAAEILKKRNPERSLPVLLEMVNSFLDADVIRDEDIDAIWHLRDLVPLFKDIHNEKTYRRLSKLLARVQKLNDDTDLKKVYLNWIVFSLAYIGAALNIESAISTMRVALPNIEISVEDSNSLVEDSNNLETLVNYFYKFQEYEGIKEILTNGLTDDFPEVEKQCLEVLERHDPNFVKDWKDKKEVNNTESEESNEPKQPE